VLVSRDEAYGVRALVTVAPVTTRARSIAAEVPLGPEDGLARSCVVNVDSLVTIAKAVLRERVARLNAQKLRALDDAIHFALGLRH
jgi:mRNA-degrading endonuclease toxin of MazEF toxin-antitoxin module